MTLPTHPSRLNELIDYLINQFDLDDLDLSFGFNWGFLKGRPVLLDYGHSYFGEQLEDCFY